MTGRDRIVILVVCALALVVGGWLLVIQPKRNEASSLGKQLTAAQSQLDAVRAQVAAGETARARFSSSYTELARLGEAVPSDDNVPSMIYQLQGAASSAGVDFRSLMLNAGAGPTPTAASTPGTAAAARALSGALPPGATVGPAGFPAEQFTFTFQGNFFNLANFFKRLEDFVIATNKAVNVSGRLMTLNAFSLGAAPGGFPSITAAIGATTYLVPAAQGLFGGASPLGPGSSSTQAVSRGGSSSATPPAAAITP